MTYGLFLVTCTAVYALILLFQPTKRQAVDEWMVEINPIYRDTLRRMLDDRP